MSKGEKTRQRIVAEAATLFNERGFEGGSMADLMEATGLEKGGIYRHFSSKETLAAAAFDFAWQAATHVRMHDLDSVSNSVDKLKRFMANLLSGGHPCPAVARHLTLLSMRMTAIVCFGNAPAEHSINGRIFFPTSFMRDLNGRKFEKRSIPKNWRR
jgi:AcrR family transcriptional regulator